MGIEETSRDVKPSAQSRGKNGGNMKTMRPGKLARRRGKIQCRVLIVEREETKRVYVTSCDHEGLQREESVRLSAH